MAGSKMPIPPQTDPWNAYKTLFSDINVMGADQAAAAKRKAGSMRVMDAVADQYRSLSKKLSPEDQAQGLWMKVPSQPHNNLLVSVLNMFGLPQTKFGHPDFCTGALAGLV